MRRWILVGSVAALVSLAVTMYIRQDAPRSELVRAVGVVPRTPFGSRYCRSYVHHLAVGFVYTGYVRCAWARRLTPGRDGELDEIDYHIVSRRPRFVGRQLYAASRDRWVQDLDSVRAALKSRGGIRSCMRLTRHSADHLREFWRFPAFEISIVSRDSYPPLESPGQRPSWHIFLDGRPGRWPGCAGSPDVSRASIVHHFP